MKRKRPNSSQDFLEGTPTPATAESLVQKRQSAIGFEELYQRAWRPDEHFFRLRNKLTSLWSKLGSTFDGDGDDGLKETKESIMKSICLLESRHEEFRWGFIGMKESMEWQQRRADELVKVIYGNGHERFSTFKNALYDIKREDGSLQRRMRRDLSHLSKADMEKVKEAVYLEVDMIRWSFETPNKAVGVRSLFSMCVMSLVRSAIRGDWYAPRPH
jgi:hypothetical protein